MITRKVPSRSGVAIATALVSVVAMSSCDEADGREPDTTVMDELQSDPDVPFDPDVSDFGDNTETDERNNQGFEVDEPGPVGNQTNPNE